MSSGKQPLEQKIQDELIEFLGARGWLVERMIGNALQRGIPDLFLYHRKYEYRWVDVKRPDKYSFTKAQKEKWPRWTQYGVGIWILTGANDTEYAKLFQPPNWRAYWKDSWGTPINVDEVLDLIEG